MRAIKITFILAVSAMLFSGCAFESKYKDAKLRNRSQLQRIDELESQYNVAKLQLAQLQKQLAEVQELYSVDTEAMKKKIAALEADVAAKNVLIGKMQAELVRGGSALPPELASELEKFAAQSDMISFDESSGMVKFKSDLLFNKGSDVVASDAVSALGELCKIINSKAASGFDVIIAGYTDDVPIRRPQTRALHPTNWHLSAHRAISVGAVMQKDGVAPKRLSMRAFGQYRPVEANAPGQKGNPKNRRVEIYLVPAGL